MQDSNDVEGIITNKPFRVLPCYLHVDTSTAISNTEENACSPFIQV